MPRFANLLSSWLIRPPSIPSISSFKVQTTSHDQKIFHIHNMYPQPNAIISPGNAAEEIDNLFPLNRPGNRENEEPESSLLEMWNIVVSVAEQIPWKHPGQNRLVEFIRGLRDLPEPTTVQMDDWGELVIWSGLPILGPVMMERNHGMRFIFHISLCLIFHWHCYSLRSRRNLG